MTSANIAAHLPRVAAERPHQLAVLAGMPADPRGVEQLTFAALQRASDQLAWGLSSYGIGRGTRTLLLVRAGLPLITLTFALFKVGAVPILIDPAMGRTSLLACIAECAPQALVGIPRAHLARLRYPKPFASVQRAVTVGPFAPWGGATLDQLRLNIDAPFPLAEVTDDELAAILFTSGSTGVPKGVAYTHGMFQAQVVALRALYQFAPGEIEMPAFPLFALFNVALGLTSAIPPIDPTRPASCDPAAVVAFVQHHRVTSTFGSPAIWQKVTRYCLDSGTRLPTLRRVLMAGAPVPPILHERFQLILREDADTHTPYGATEALPVASASGREVLAAMRERDDPLAGTCVGRAAPGITLKIIPIDDDPIAEWDDDLALPAGQIGEIVVTGAVVTHAYVNRPQQAARAKIRAGDQIWHRMGDLGYFDDAGRLWFYGRKSQRVRTAAGELYTEPCELVCNAHPAVARSALVGVPAAAGYQRPVLVIEPLDKQLLTNADDRAALVAELRARTARYPMTAAIDTFVFHPSFPVDIRHNAKIFREQLATWAAGELASTTVVTG